MKLQPEEREAIDFVRLFRLRWRRHSTELIHLANERRVSPGARGAVTHALLARAGYRPGAADYFLFRPAGGLAGLWLEMKAPGGRLEETQAQFLAETRTAGYASCVTWGCYAAMFAVELYLIGRSEAFRADVLGFPVTEPMPGVGYGPVPLWQLTKTGTLPRRGPRGGEN